MSKSRSGNAPVSPRLAWPDVRPIGSPETIVPDPPGTRHAEAGRDLASLTGRKADDL